METLILKLQLPTASWFILACEFKTALRAHFVRFIRHLTVKPLTKGKLLCEPEFPVQARAIWQNYSSSCIGRRTALSGQRAINNSHDPSVISQ